jgi:hypothetical protein
MYTPRWRLRVRFWGFDQLVTYSWGAACGIITGWIWWRLPDHWAGLRAKFQVWREQLPHNAREIARIEGGLYEDVYVENYVEDMDPTPPLRERILEYWRQWQEDTKPRTPEGVARASYWRQIGVT